MRIGRTWADSIGRPPGHLNVPIGWFRQRISPGLGSVYL
jgi:hypothetical protein